MNDKKDKPKNKTVTTPVLRNGPLKLVNPEDITSGNCVCKVVCDKHGPCWEFDNPFCPIYDLYLKKKFGCPKCSGKYRRTEEEFNKYVQGMMHPTLTLVAAGVFNGLKTKARVKCEKHGNCWEFGNPSEPTYKTLQLGKPCLKCQGHYNQTKAEAKVLIHQALAAQAPKLSLVDIEDYKNQNSRCLVTCEEHGDLWLWGVGTKPTMQLLLREPKCLKCNGTYIGTKEEKIFEINALLAKCILPHLKVIDIQGDMGDRAPCVIECPKHGRSDKWQNKTLPSVGNLKRTYLRDSSNGCPKCGGNYRFSVAEYETEIRAHLAEVNPKLTLVAIADFKGNSSLCLLHCQEHGLLSEFETKSLPIISKVLSYQADDGCSKCSKKYHRSLGEVMQELGNESGRDVFIRGFAPSTGYIGGDSRCLVTCKEHGNGEDFANPYIPRLWDFENSPPCSKCNGSYQRTKEETILELNEASEGHYIVLDIPNFQNSETPVKVKCTYHGPGWLLDPPWAPTSGHMRRGRGCKRCFYEVNNLIILRNNPHLANKPRVLYFAKVTVQETGEVFYKIGLRKNKMSTRYAKANQRKDGVVIDELSSYTTDNQSVLLAEFLSFFRFAEYRINRQRVLQHCYGGTECFSKNLLEMTTLEQLVMDARNDQKRLLQLSLKFNRYEKD
jgi:hypothetical protein